MPLTFVGLGLWDEQDVSLRGLAAAREADEVFAEWYTAHLGGATPERIEALLGRPVRVLSREEVESGNVLLETARRGSAVLLAAGDSLTATTHATLRARAHREGIGTRVIHGASVVTAVPGLLGLQSYKFGRSTTIVYPEGRYFPTSPYDVVHENLDRGLHTLCLLDLRAGGSEHENRPSTAPAASARHMTAGEGAALLLRMEAERKEGVLSARTLACAVARAGSPRPRVVRGPLEALAAADLGPPLHAVVVPGKLHFAEEEALAALSEPLG